MADFSIGKGDRLPAIEAELLQGEKAVNLTGATVEIRYRPQAGGAVTTKTASITDAAKGCVSYGWVSGDTDTAGVYVARWRVTYADGKKSSFPNVGFIKIAITDDL